MPAREREYDIPDYAAEAHDARDAAVRPSPVPHIPRDQPLTPAEVEEFMTAYIHSLEETNEVLEQALATQAAAESDYRIKRARATLLSEEKTGQVKDADGIYQAREELRARDMSLALAEATKETLRNRRAILDGLRTLMVTARDLAKP